MKKAAAIAILTFFLFFSNGCLSTEVEESKSKATDAVEKYNDSIKERTTINEE